MMAVFFLLSLCVCVLAKACFLCHQACFDYEEDEQGGEDASSLLGLGLDCYLGILPRVVIVVGAGRTRLNIHDDKSLFFISLN